MVLLFNWSFWVRLAVRFGISIAALAIIIGIAVFVLYFFGKDKKHV